MSGSQEPQAPLRPDRGSVVSHPTDIGVRRIGAGWDNRPAADESERGRRISLQRDGLFRHSLLVADVVAFVVALLVLDQLSPRMLVLTWASLVGLLGLFLDLQGDRPL